MSAQILLYLAPALLLLAALGLGHYPGERLLDAIFRGWAPALAREAEPATRRLPPARSFPRGGALLAMALAGRGPPSRSQIQLGRHLQRKEAMKLKSILALIGVLALAVPAGAGAHVTLQPSEAAAGDFTVLDVRVPNETDDSATTKVDVQFPPGFVFASYQPVPGWSVKVQMEKLAKPITSHGEEITEQVAQMTWTADGAGIQPGQFLDFPISVQIPVEAGDTLTFKALQTYDDGEVVRWIGAPDSEKPAPQVTVTEGGEEHGAAADDDAAESSDSDDGGDGLAIAALIVGLLGLLLGGAALARSRRTS